MTIRRKLTAGVLTVFLVSFAFVGLATVSIARISLTRSIVEQMLVVADGYASDIETQLNTYERVVRDLSRDILAARTPSSALQAKADLYTDIERFYQTDHTGDVVAQYPESAIFGAYNYRYEPFWQELSETHEPSMSELRRVYGYPSFTFSAPIRDPDSADAVTGFVHAVVSSQTLFSSVESVVVGEEGYLFVTDSRGRFLSHPTESSLRSVSDLSGDERLEDLQRQMRDSGRAAGFYRANKTDHLMAFAPLRNGGWSLGVSVPAQYYTGEVDRAMVFLGILLAIAAFVVSALTSILVGRTLRPVYALVESISDVGDRSFGKKVQVAVEDEIGALANAYNDMTERLERSFRTIQEYSRTLEQTVQDRTEQLRDANRALRADQREMERQLTMARRVQQNLLPEIERYPDNENLLFAGKYVSMDDVGGDFYDVFHIAPGVYAFLIADVSGHGMPAALITAMVKVSFHTNLDPDARTDEVLTRVNDEMFEFIGDLEYFVSAFFAIYDTHTRRLRYTNAGHHPALLYRRNDNSIEKLDSEGLFIASFEEVPYVEQETRTEPGDRLIMFTDGIVEARDAFDQFYEYDRFLESVKRHLQLDPRNFVAAIFDDVTAFMGGEEVNDDQAIFCVDFDAGYRSSGAAGQGGGAERPVQQRYGE